MYVGSRALPAALIALFLQTMCAKVQHGLSSPGSTQVIWLATGRLSEGFRGAKRQPGHGSRMP